MVKEKYSKIIFVTFLVFLCSLAQFVTEGGAEETVSITTDDGKGIIDVIIYTLAGQSVMQGMPVNGMMDVSNLQPGMYIVEVTVKNTRIRQKLLVQR